MGVHIHLTGAVIPKQYPVTLSNSVKAYDIPVGTLLAIVSGFLVPVDQFTWDTDLATTRAAFAAAFAGVSSGASDKDVPLDTRDENILVTQDGEFEVDVASATYAVGDLLAPVKAAGNALTNQLNKTSATDANALFRVSQTYASATTRVRAYILKTLPKRDASA